MNTYQVLMGEITAAEARCPAEVEQLHVIPAHKNLIGANIELVPLDHREFRLRYALDTVRNDYEFVVIDCPPALDLLTLNALVAADSVLIPMQAEYFALEGVTELLDTIDRIKAELNPGLAVEGVVITMFDDRTNLAQSVAADLRGFFGELMCETTIPRNIRLAEAPSHGKPALLYDPKSRGCEAYLQLAQEIMDRARRDQSAVEAVNTPGACHLIGRKVEKIHDGKAKSAGSGVGYAAAFPSGTDCAPWHAGAPRRGNPATRSGTD